jgi:glycosidase
MFFTDKTLPRLNNENPAARAHVLDAVRYWVQEYGVDGYRLDYVLGPSHDFWTAYYKAIKGLKADTFSVGEATHGGEMLRTYEGRLDCALDFVFLTMIRGLIAFNTVTLASFDRFLEQSAHFFSSDFVLPTFLDNHDMNRFLWVARGDTRKLRLAAAIQFTLAAPPIIYYGTEVGIRQKGDVRTGGWGRDVEARGPMLWGAEQDADLLAYYSRLALIRHTHPAIRRGTRTLLHLDNQAGTYAYSQTAHDQAGIVALFNLRDTPQTVDVPLPPGGRAPAAPVDLLNGLPVRRTATGLAADLPPFGAAVVAID